MKQKLYDGWLIRFQPNVHMYCHHLTAGKDGLELEVPCEDLPVAEKLVGLWPYTLNLEPELSGDLLKGLVAWANASGLKYRIYTTKEAFESN